MAERVEDRRKMWTGKRKAAGLVVLFVLAAAVLTACGSANDTPTIAPPAVSVTTADHLAKLSDRIATDLDAGDLCHAAHAADDLQAAVEDSDLPTNLRTGVDTVAGDLVNQVNCPPPPEPEPEKKKEHKGDENKQGDKGPKPPGHGGTAPPGQAKLKGEG